MVKTGLKIYKNNIWHFFTILGFVSLGVIIGLSLLIPAISNEVENASKNIGAAAEELHIKEFNGNNFIQSLVNQFKAMNWANPMETLQTIFSNNAFVTILKAALKESGLNVDQIAALEDVIVSSSKQIVDTSINEFAVLITSMSICSIIGYVLIRSIIHFRSTENRNLIKYIFSLVAELILMCFVTYLITLTVQGVKTWWCYVALIACLFLLMLGLLTISFWTYAKKGVKFKDIVNIKTMLGLIITDSIIMLLSFIIVAIIYPFNPLAAIMIAIPLLIITSIIIDCTASAYVVHFNNEQIKTV